MAAEERYARLGFFVVVGLIVMLVTGLFFIQRLKSREAIALVTYFTENVSGLDISSPVRYRGVSVGRVSDVRIHPDGVTIEVDFELFQDRLASIGASVTRVQQGAELPMAPRLRARVVGNPVTGEGYLLLDIPNNAPPPIALGFTPRRGYVPSMPSPLNTVQDRLPEVLKSAEETFQTLTEIVARVPASLDRSDRFFTSVDRLLAESHLPELSADLRTFSTATTAQIAQIGSSIDQIASNMDRVVGTDGSLMKFAEEARNAIREANAAESAHAARDAADRTTMAADDLRRSLPAIRDTLALLRELTRHLDEQPESVIYGPRPPQAKR
jgi:ABC-type transporter Mla subunit MlaD